MSTDISSIFRKLEFCAEECARQESGEISVANMFIAYVAIEARLAGQMPIDLTFIETLGILVEPDKNISGFRNTPVSFANGEINSLRRDAIERKLERLLNMGVFGKDPTLFYLSFEDIHPFVDGNGRVGALLFNWLNETLENPVAAPQFTRAALMRSYDE